MEHFVFIDRKENFDTNVNKQGDNTEQMGSGKYSYVANALIPEVFKFSENVSEICKWKEPTTLPWKQTCWTHIEEQIW